MIRPHKAVREVMDYAKGHGFTIRSTLTGTGHWVIVHESGEAMTLPATPRGGRWTKNAEAQIRRIERKAEQNA